MSLRPRYAFFDFDGTLISQDSFLIILKAGFLQQPWRVLFIILFSPLLALTYLFKLDKTLAKSLLLWSVTVFKGKKGAIQFFQNTLLPFANSMWFQEALTEFEKLKNEQIEIIVISASGTPWVRALLRGKYTNFKLIIGSKLGFCLGGIILTSKNCYKEEKIRRIQEILGHNFEWHSAWSDHIADLPMLKKAGKRYVICPKQTHVDIFNQELEKNYTLLSWTTLKG